MKGLVSVLFCLIGAASFAQDLPKAEGDLVKAYTRIEKLRDDNKDEEIDKANRQFFILLQQTVTKYPQSLTFPFDKLKTTHVNVSTSDDGRLRIYSWDTWTGGTMHFFENLFQYKAGSVVKTMADTLQGDGDNRPNYNKLYTLNASGNTYYLAVSMTIGSSKDVGQGISVFAVEAGKLNDKVKLIKTASGMHNSLSINYNFFSIVDWKERPVITYDAVKQTIQLPLVDGKGNVTHKEILYKFNGQYFEKVKI